MKQSKVTERFLKYVKIPTASREESTSVPSTPCQFNLAHFLVEELHELGISNAFVDEKCYVYANLPASEGCENAPAMGFISHMDTVSDFADHGVEPVITENYDGQDFPLGESGRVLKLTDFPHLAALKGRTLITSDGTTILGADDKAGVAEIVTMVEEILEKDIPHGPISIGFTPDEEIGCGADYFDVPGFGADYAYTVDGGIEGSIEYENFNAAGVELTVHGFNVHPGDAKDIMINAALVLMEANAMLPTGETPRDTEGYEGFFHLTDMNGNVEKAHASYIVRDHDAQHFEKRLEQMQEIVKKLNRKYGDGTVTLEIKRQYKNMAEKILPCFHLVERAQQAICENGLEPVTLPIRGGTDGARLSFMGLPCPNLGTGGHAFHGPYEHITVEGMESVVQIMLNIVSLYSGVEK